jgi:hypothetical protein
LVVAGRYIGNPDDARAAFGALHELKPLIADGRAVPIQNVSDGREALEAKGGFQDVWHRGLATLRCREVFSPPSRRGSVSWTSARMPSTLPSTSNGTRADQVCRRSSQRTLSMISDFGSRAAPGHLKCTLASSEGRAEIVGHP